MKICTQNRSQGTLTVQRRFGLGCISGAVAHAVFYLLEVSETALNVSMFLFCSVEGCRLLTDKL
ncbi:hypothetical protein CHARACLAT_030980 [Characodon lateralis]|uniref:Uncharacterized protein n=1 Tax=Characodon lateralis TaxID=208331 RepID=A0ABU7EHJ3_9TELE|nr:hypothetical protein [Characodon lateralis]